MKCVIVKSSNPEWLDKTLNMIGGILRQDNGEYETHDGGYLAQTIDGADPSFLEFAIRNQGYGEVLCQCDMSPK